MKYLLGLILGVFLVPCFQYGALGAAAPKIAVVDVQELQNRSQAFQKERAALKKKFDPLMKKLEAEKKSLVKLEEDFQKQSMMLSLDAKEDKKRELDKKRRYYKYLQADVTQDLKDAELKATKRVLKELEKIVRRIAKKKGYILILERRTVGLIFYSDAIDITNQVVEAYDRSKQ